MNLIEKIKKGYSGDIFRNILWLLIDKALILILGFFIGAKVANFYGVKEYGYYSYYISIFAFSAIFFEILNTGITKKYFSKSIEETISTVKIFQIFISIVIISIAIVFSFFEPKYTNKLVIIFIALNTSLMSISGSIELYFEYILKSKYIVFTSNIVKIVCYLLQALFISNKLPIYYIVFAQFIATILRYGLVVVISKKKFKLKIKYIFKKNIFLDILNESKYFWFAYIAYVIYSQIDRIMIGKMIGIEEVGIFNIANQLINILILLIPVFQTSFFPKLYEKYLINLNEFKEYYVSLINKIFYLYCVIILSSCFIVEKMFDKIFSFQYIESKNIYYILCVGVLIRVLGMFRSTYLNFEKKGNSLLMTTLISCFLNIVLNILIIPKFKLVGVAIVSVITQLFSLILLDFLIKNNREYGKIHLVSMNPYLLIKKGKNVSKKIP